MCIWGARRPGDVVLVDVNGALKLHRASLGEGPELAYLALHAATHAGEKLRNAMRRTAHSPATQPASGACVTSSGFRLAPVKR